MNRRSSVICETRACQIEIQSQRQLSDGWLRDPMVLHWSDPVWYVYVDPAQCDEDGMLKPEEIQRLSQMAEREHEKAGAA